MMLTDLADVLRDAGLRVEEVPGWKDNARPASTGGFAPRGNLWHHTGAKDTNPLSIEDDRAYARWLADVGRLDLPAPLCQLSVGRNGTIYVCAAGRGNHAGTAKASGPMPAGDGNALYLGWECQNSGSEGWTPAQYDAMVRGAVATSQHYGWTWDANRAHKETSLTGKWDPGLLDMDKFRRDIHSLMEDDMAQYDEVLEAIADDAKAARRQSEKNGRLTYRRDISIMEAITAVAEAVADDATKAQVRKIAKKLDEMAEPEGGDEAPRA